MNDFLKEGLLEMLPLAVQYLMLGYLGAKAIDMATGILKTWKNGGYKSAKMRDGLIRWIGEMVGIVFVIMMDLILGLNFYLCGMTLSLFLYKEAGSIIENLGVIGVYLPPGLKEKLEVLDPKKGE